MKRRWGILFLVGAIIAAVAVMVSCAGYSWTARPSVGVVSRMDGETTGMTAGLEFVPEKTTQDVRLVDSRDFQGDPTKWLANTPHKELPIWKNKGFIGAMVALLLAGAASLNSKVRNGARKMLKKK